MKKIILLAGILFLAIIATNTMAQVISTNRNPVSLEHNLLFNANTRYAVKQSGNGQLSLPALFDGRFAPSYSSDAPTAQNPLVIEVEGLPKYHTQAGAWFGWSTRYWPASRFKVEGFNVYQNENKWVTIADYQNKDYGQSDFLKKCPGGQYTKFRLTVYKATGTDGRLGIAELYFIHPEATQPYAGILDNASKINMITTNRNPVGLEHNLLFSANTRYAVKQSGSGQLSLPALFDGRFAPSYSSDAPTAQNPLVIEIEGLPKYHTQAGAWFGWSTRHWPASRFKVEGFNVYQNKNKWVTIADYQNKDYSQSDFLEKCPGGQYTKFRMTVYKATGAEGRLGISELFFIHPEATQPYGGLFEANAWKKNGAKLYYKGGNVGIGTDNPGSMLTVAGKIESREVEVTVNAGADFVFDESYDLKEIEEVEAFIKENKHLPEIAPANQMEAEGINLSEMNIKLLQKIEELTLYLINQNKILKMQADKINNLENEIKEVKETSAN